MSNSARTMSVVSLRSGDIVGARECGGEKRTKTRYWSLETTPPVLILSLKRFDINYANMSRFKVNTKFSFPLVLDVSALKRGGNTEDTSEDPQSPKDSDKDSVTSKIRHNMIWLEQLKTKNGEQEARKRYRRLVTRSNPDDVYELYAIIIHSGRTPFTAFVVFYAFDHSSWCILGGAYSGHYHAYIKDFHAGTTESPAATLAGSASDDNHVEEGKSSTSANTNDSAASKQATPTMESGSGSDTTSVQEAKKTHEPLDLLRSLLQQQVG